MKRLFLLLALCGMVAVGCTEGGVDDNIDNGGNNTEQPGEDDDDENKEDDAIFITDSKGNVVVEAEGGEVVVTVTTDIKYSVEIPEEAQLWLSVADTRAIRMEKLTFTVADNDTFEERSANVELVDSDGKSLQTIKFLQRASDKVFEIDDEGKHIIEAQGGVVEVDVTTNIEYDVVIPDDAQQWISVADTRAEVRNEKLTFTVAANETFEERSADVELVDSKGKSLQTINFTQLAKSNVMANNEIWYTTTDNKRVIPPSTEPTVFGAYFISNTYSDGKGVLTFDGEITKIGNGAFKNIGNLASITIPDSVTSIGSSAFYGCSNLTSITIPDSVKSIGSEAFRNCTSLTSVTIPDSVTSIGSYAFRNCDLLTSVTIPDSVTSIGNYAFYDCDSLTSVTIPNSVTSIGDFAFYDCTSLTSVTIGKGVTSIGKNAFSGCTGELIVNCNIPSASSSEYGAFYGSKFTQVTIGDSVTSIGSYAFYGCDSLTCITIPGSVTSIGVYAFIDCTGELIVNCNIQGQSVSMPEYGDFYGSKFTQVTIGDSVSSIGDDAFYDCYWLTSVYITDIAAWCKISFGNNYSNPLNYAENLYLNNELVTDLIIPDGAKKIGSYAFYGYDLLTSVTIPDSVTSIGDEAFYNCDSLTSVTIPDSVTSIGSEAFRHCDSLTSVTIGNGVTSIGDGAFWNCDSLASVYTTDIAAWCNISFGNYASNPLNYAENLYLNNELVTDLIIPDGVTKIGSYAFYSFPLTSVTIPDSVTSIGSYAFSYCDSLTSVTIPDSVTSIGSRVFSYCDSLTSVTIGKGVTEIGWYAFYWCTSLTSVYITDIAAWCNISFGINYSNPLYWAENLYLNNELVTDLIIPDGAKKIGSYAFYGYDLLTSVTIPDSVTSIGDLTFYNCDSLKSVTIGKGVNDIGESAFDDCTSLKEVYCKPTTPPSASSWMFYDNASGRKIYVPRNSVSAYKSAWSSYASDIVGYDF